MSLKSKRFLALAVDWLLCREQAPGDWRRYVRGSAVSVLAICFLAILYLWGMPKQYTSEWSIILPGAGVASSIALRGIGQTRSSAASPFSSKEISPRVNYKEIARSKPVRQAAADRLNLSLGAFGMPKLRLVDRTSIIEFAIYGKSPEIARRKALALHDALEKKLNALRQDEIDRRNRAIRYSLANVKRKLGAARKRLLDLQLSSGLVSLDQYDSLVSTIEGLRRNLSETEASLAEHRQTATAVAARVGIDAESAAALFLVNSDPEYRYLWRKFAKASATYAENVANFGSNHPRLREAVAIKQSMESALRQFLRRKANRSLTGAELALLSSNHDKTLGILTDLIANHATIRGLESRISEITNQLNRYEKRQLELSVAAAELDDAERDHKIANVVFSSALARIDASKSDVYASYPLMQVLDSPTLPSRPSSPRPMFAVVGAGLGSVLAIMAWMLAWLHQRFASLRMTRRSSFTPYA